MPRIIDKPGTVIVNEWSVDDFTRAFEIPTFKANEGEVLAKILRMGCGGNDTYYAGLTSCAEATALLDSGWREGADRLQAIRQELSPPEARSRKRRGAWSDAGDELNVDRALVGNWDNAWRLAKAQWTNQTQNVDLYCILGGAYYLTAENLFWQGATVVVLADLLEAAGYCVRIIGSSLANPSTPYDAEICTTNVVVKEYSDPMRLDTIASVLCHSGVFRTHGFKALLSCPRPVSTGMGYYGKTWSNVERQLRSIGEWDESSIHVSDAYTREGCMSEINRVIKLLGGQS